MQLIWTEFEVVCTKRQACTMFTYLMNRNVSAFWQCILHKNWYFIATILNKVFCNFFQYSGVDVAHWHFIRTSKAKANLGCVSDRPWYYFFNKYFFGWLCIWMYKGKIILWNVEKFLLRHILPSSIYLILFNYNLSLASLPGVLVHPSI